MSALPRKTTIVAPDLSWTRRRWGRGFQYFDEHGRKITDRRILRKLKKLAIPPMWREVRISRSSRAKIQATGRDRKGRKQYRYHPAWIRQQQRLKFERLREFGQRLPELRARAFAALGSKGWAREKVLALMVLILDETGIRIGNRQYLAANDTYGLTTLRRRHLDHEDEALVFHYQGKSGKAREVKIEETSLIPFIRKAAEQPGYEIFRFRNEAGSWESIDSEDINSFIQKHLGDAFSSKDFRTWVANRLLVEMQEQAHVIKQANPRRTLKNILIRLVANKLGNTPAVCKRSYIHPRVLQQIVAQPPVELMDEQENWDASHSKSEELLLEMLRRG